MLLGELEFTRLYYSLLNEFEFRYFWNQNGTSGYVISLDLEETDRSFGHLRLLMFFQRL